MTPADIYRMAHEAKAPRLLNCTLADLERFAALVAAAEREACANALEQALNDAGYATAGYFGAKVIRARGESHD